MELNFTKIEFQLNFFNWKSHVCSSSMSKNYLKLDNNKIELHRELYNHKIEFQNRDTKLNNFKTEAIC